MAEIYIHIPGGEQLSIVPEASSSQDWTLMGDNKLSLSFQQYECVILPAGSWCEFDGVLFYLLQEYKPTMIHSHLWQYNVAFVDGASWLGVTTALKTIDGEDAPLFTLTAPAAEHAAIIVSNLNRRLGTTVWKVGSVIDTPNITIEYTGKYCGAVLQEIVDDQNTEWWVDGTTLNIGRAEFGSLIELGYRDGLLGDITVTQTDNMSSYRTLYPVGSTRNILPTEYGHDRLQLPNGQKSVMMNPAGVAELVEEAAFAGIYPRYVGTVTGVSTSIGQSADGSQYLIYNIADTAIPFNPNDYEMPGLVKRITFQSGELKGAEFEVNYYPASNEFELITQFPENGNQLPGGMLIPQVGDEYVVWNISMPAEYYPLAEQELLEAAESFAASSIRESNVYKVKLDYIDVQERGLSLRPGQKVRLHSLDYFPEQGYYDSRITRITRPVNYPGEYTIDVSAVRVVGSLTRLQTSLAAATTKVNNLSNTVQTVVQTVTNAVTLTGNQRVRGVKDFVDGVKIGGLPLYPINENTVFLDANIVFGGAATMFGLGSTTFPSIWKNIPFDDTMRWDGSKWSVVGGTGSGGGTADSVAWGKVTDKPSWITDEKPKYTYTEIADTPDLSVYATKSSVDAVSTRLNDFLAGSDADTIINKWSELEVFLSGLSESNNLATILSDKANKATSLAGYGITDAYTKGHIDSTFVKLATVQSITARHDFVDGLMISGLPIYKSQDKTIYLDANLVVSGSFTMFGKDSTTFPTIWANIPFDDTMRWDGSRWSVVASTGGGGGVADNAATANRLIEEIVTDLNNATAGRIFTMTSGYGSTAGNKPNDGWVTGLTLQYAQNGIYRRQLAFCDDLYFREEHNGSWGSWRKILSESNYSEYALPIKGGTVNGNVRINKFLTVGAASSSTNTARAQIHLVSSGANPCDLYFGADDTLYWSVTARNAADAGGFNKAFALYDVTNSAYRLMVFPNGNIGIGGTTASYKLHVHGTLGVSGEVTFGGKVNMSGQVTFAASGFLLAHSPNDTWTGANNVAHPWYGMDFRVGGNYKGTISHWSGITLASGNDINLSSQKNIVVSNGNFRINQSAFDNGLILNRTAANAGVGIVAMSNNVRLGQFGINGTKTFEVSGDNGIVMQVSCTNGNLLISGALGMNYSSDERLKKNIRKVNASEVLMSLGGVWQYEYIDSEVKRNSVYDGTHFGLIYQNVKGKPLDKMCHKREDGMGALNYVDADFISIIAGATMENISEVEKLKKSNQELKKSNQELKKKVEQLEKRVA